MYVNSVARELKSLSTELFPFAARSASKGYRRRIKGYHTSIEAARTALACAAGSNPCHIPSPKLLRDLCASA